MEPIRRPLQDQAAERVTGVKERLKIPHTPFEVRRPLERVKDFGDAVIGYDAKTARQEASRCLQCPTPAACMAACPLHNDIPGALWLIAQGDFLGAAELYRQTSIFPEICGRVCPQEKLCEGACVIGRRAEAPSLGKLEMFAADYQRHNLGWPALGKAPATGKDVAVVGSGPAGLAVAEALAKRGHAVTVYEAASFPGGLLLYGIPGFKLPKELITGKIAQLEALGVRFICSTRIGQRITVDDLFLSGYHAVFLGVGANVDAKVKMPGLDLPGVYQAGEFLARANLLSAGYPDTPAALNVGRRVAVIGGGDTAMDCLRAALRLGAHTVTCYYRRTEAEMPGSAADRQHAVEEGADIVYLAAPTRVLGNEVGCVRAIELQRMELGEPDDSGRRRPVVIKGSEFIQPVDTVVLALGYWPDELIGKTTPNLTTHDYGLINADAAGRTSRPGVFAGGDDVSGPDLVSTAMAAGLRTAQAMHEYLQTLSSTGSERTPDSSW